MAKPAALSALRLAPVLGALAMIGPFSIDTIFPAFPRIGAQFGADKLAMQQTISAYLFAYALMSIAHGPLSDALGRRRVILAGLAMFGLASVGCALSTSLPMLLAFRVLQGLSAGVGLIVGRAVIRDVLHGHDAQRLMSQVSMIFGIAPAIAPLVGAWLLGWSRWPAIFWFLAVFALVLSAAVVWRLPETHPIESRQPLRVAPMVRGYWAMLRDPPFLRLALAGSLNFAALFLYIASAPALVLDHLRLGQNGFGWFFIPMIGGMMLGAFVSGRLAGRMDGTAQIRIGFACCIAAALLNAAYHYAVVVPAVLPTVLPVALNSFGIALVFPILTLAILDMFPAVRGAASSMQAFIGLLANALVAGLVSPWLSGDLFHLALAAGLLSVLAWLFWRWEYHRRSRPPRTPQDADEARALEPTNP
ncbi:Bcr/CflA drug resistance transporter protein [Lysobacter silvestris]|uniref:Bcr/CflA family efflux transporter n=2 Tax=Solilutibacter silvestris TaxID=1645665 RepID=A0A2K1Q3S2_9GAMM|nr:multidrug effflux MFS transporter [Lysobacter silvestris]PNS09702.1 Bcr/CflA drug resistance transporter protein [Lysobacter silvestris]